MATARTALALLALTSIALVAGPAARAVAATPVDPEDQIVLSGTADVPRGREVGEVVVLHGSASIAGVALGDVVVLDGRITVAGQVSGSVIAVNGPIRLGPNAHVGGDVTARGDIRLSQGATVDGRTRQHAAFTWRTPVSVFGRFASWLAVTVSTLLLGLGLILLTPRAADASFEAAGGSPWSAGGWGLGLAIGLPIIALLASVSLVALPLGLVVLLALAFVAFAGYVLTAFFAGRLLWGPPRGRLLAFVFGWAILRAVGAIPIVSGATFGLAAGFGVGAAAVAIWRARSAGGGKHREGRVVRLPEHVPEEAGL